MKWSPNSSADPVVFRFLEDAHIVWIFRIFSGNCYSSCCESEPVFIYYKQRVIRPLAEIKFFFTKIWHKRLKFETPASRKRKHWRQVPETAWQLDFVRTRGESWWGLPYLAVGWEGHPTQTQLLFQLCSSACASDNKTECYFHWCFTYCHTISPSKTWRTSLSLVMASEAGNNAHKRSNCFRHVSSPAVTASPAWCLWRTIKRWPRTKSTCHAAVYRWLFSDLCSAKPTSILQVGRFRSVLVV